MNPAAYQYMAAGARAGRGQRWKGVPLSVALEHGWLKLARCSCPGLLFREVRPAELGRACPHCMMTLRPLPEDFRVSVPAAELDAARQAAQEELDAAGLGRPDAG